MHSPWAGVDEAVLLAPEEAAQATALATQARMAWDMQERTIRAQLGPIVLIA